MLQADLEDKGPAILREQGSLTIQTRHDAARYNSCLHFAMSHGLGEDALRYDYDADSGVFTVYAP